MLPPQKSLPLPFSVWAVTEKGNALDMLVGGVVIHITDTFLQVGDVLLFDGDVIHRGIAYQKSCIGWHAYVDVAGVKRTRNALALGSFHPHYATLESGLFVRLV